MIAKMDQRWAPKQVEAVASIETLTRDAAQRIVGATASIDGMAGQALSIDVGAPIAIGESYLVRNEGSATSPAWRVVQRLQSSQFIPGQDTPTLPAPTNLDIESGLYDVVGDGTWRAWIFVSWLTIGAEFGSCDYEVQYKTNADVPPMSIQVKDTKPVTTLPRGIGAAGTLLPRGPEPSEDEMYDFPFRGRIRVDIEQIDYNYVTDGEGDYDITGTGGTNSFTVSGAGWTIDEWRCWRNF
jgi:hypothetical protein